MRLSAVHPEFANGKSSILSTLIQAENLDLSKTLCSYALHGRCAISACTDLHLDSICESVTVEQFFKARFEPEKHVSKDVFDKAITAALKVFSRSVAGGASNVEESLRVFVLSVLPLCRPKLM